MQNLRAFLTDPYWWLVGLFFVVTLFVYFLDARYRNKLDAAFAKLHPSSKPLGPFDLSRGNASEALRHKHLIAPERLWTYDGEYVEKFADAAWGVVLADKISMLDLYIERILRRWDLAFAVAMGVFTAFFNYGVAAALWSWSTWPLAGNLALLLAGMGVVYGVADVAENLKLSSILKYPRHVDAGETAAANFLTRIKIVSLTLSISGGVLFLVLSLLAPLCGGHDAPMRPRAQT